MILVVGAAIDPVVARVLSQLDRHSQKVAHVDDLKLGSFEVKAVAEGSARWRICRAGHTSSSPVGAVFLRRGPSGPLGAAPARQLDAVLQQTISCLVVNPPMRCASNYSKPYQLRELAAAGFRVPRTLITGSATAALEFVRDLGGRVIVKGLSSVKTIPQRVQEHHLRGLQRLVDCPVQMQELVEGRDFRVTVVGTRAVASETRDGALLQCAPATQLLPAAFVEQCIAYTQQQGLVLSGIDLRWSQSGGSTVFEMNPNPLVTHYETAGQPIISELICEELMARATTWSDILA